MIFKIHHIELDGITHMSTSWFLFPSEDTIDKTKAVYSLENSVVNKEVLDLDLVIPIGEVRYLVAYKHMSDDSIIKILSEAIHPINNSRVSTPLNNNGVDTPIIRLLENTLISSGHLKLTTDNIRPMPNVLDTLYYVLYCDGKCINMYESNNYELIIDSSDIPVGTTDVTIRVSHKDIGGVMSRYGIFKISLRSSDVTLLDNLVVPNISFIPSFKSEHILEVMSLRLIKDNKVINFSETIMFPANVLEYDTKYSIEASIKIYGIVKVYSFEFSTIPIVGKIIDLTYKYSEFSNSTVTTNILKGVSEVTPMDKLFLPFSNKFRLKFLEKNIFSYESELNLFNQVDYSSESHVIKISDNEIAFCFNSGEKYIICLFNLRPSFYSATKMLEFEVPNISSDRVLFNSNARKFYFVSEKDSKYYVSTLSLTGEYSLGEEFKTGVGLKFNISMVGDKMYLFGGVDALLRFTISENKLEYLEETPVDFTSDKVFNIPLINGDLLLLDKFSNKVIRFDHVLEEYISLTSTLFNPTAILILRDGSIHISNGSESILYH